MQGPHGPFIELNFYVVDGSEQETFTNLLMTLLASGFEWMGVGYGHHTDDITQPFTYISEYPLVPIEINNMEDYFRATESNTFRLIQLYLKGVDRAISDDDTAILTYTGISEEASLKDHHPVALWMNGDSFTGGWEDVDSEKQRKAGIEVYKLFLTLIKAVHPSYASITMEYSLESPTDLSLDYSNTAFKNFYISGDLLADRIMESILELYKDAYIEVVNSGYYISTSKDSNPSGKNINTNQSCLLAKEVIKRIIQSFINVS